MRFRTVAITGGSGFIGKYLVARLLSRGFEVRLAVRRRAHAGAMQMLPLSITECDIHDPLQLTAFLDGADTVINLVGVLQDRRAQPYGPVFKKVHVDLPGKMAEACVRLGIRRLLHMSALHADSKGPSMYLRSKGDGEKRLETVAQATGAAGSPTLWTTIFRPSVVFGPDDKFLNTFAAMQKILPLVPLASPGARFQPIFVGDVADAFVNAIETDATFGQAYELGGPAIYTLAELVRFAGQASGHPRPILGLPDWVARLQGALFERLPNAPITRDNIDSMTIDSILRGPIDPVLRVHPVAMTSVAGDYLAGRPIGQRFAAGASEPAAAGAKSTQPANDADEANISGDR